MNIFQAAFLGVIEGLTEFLPISSTFHLIWASKIIGLPQSDFLKLFEVFIQSGAILAVAFLYTKIVLKEPKLIRNIVVSFIPTAVIGLVFYKVIKNSLFENYVLQLAIFVVVGLFFLVFEKWIKNKELQHTIEKISIRDAVIVGFAQALAVFPGVSRAGAVIVTLMILKVKRQEAAKYSFLLAVPTLLSASALDLFKSKDVLIQNTHNIPLLLIGFVFAFITAIFVVKWFIVFLQNNDLTKFGWYRVVAGVLLFITG